MGLEKTTEKKTYLNIVGGKIAKRCNEDTINAVARYSEKTKKTIHELLFDKVSGSVTSIGIEKNDFGKSLVIAMNDNGESFVLTIPTESKYFDSFCNKIGNCDLAQPLSVAPFSFEKDGKKYTGVNLYTNGNKADYYFTKESPKGKPFTGEAKLDDEDWKVFKIQERKFFCEYIETLTNKAKEQQVPF